MADQSLKQRTAKGLFWEGLSNGMRQLLGLAFGIALARLLDDTDYGMIGVLGIFSAVANTLQESGFIMALANKRDVAHKDYNAVFWFSLLTGLGIYVLLFFSAPLIARFFGSDELIPLSRFLFLGFVMSGATTAHSAYLFRNLMSKQRAFSQVPALLLSGIVGVTMACNGMSYWGIATQNLVYIGVVNACYWYFSPWRPTLRIDFRPLREMFGFSSKVLVTNLFLQANNNLLSTVLGYFYSKADVGVYTQSAKWNSMGSSLIEGMINGVAQPVLSTVNDDASRQLNVLRKMLRFAAFLSFPAMLGLALIAEEFILISITAKWLACVPILQMLCIWGAFIPVITLYTRLLISKGKSDVYMWNTIALSLLQLLVMLVMYPYGIRAMVAVFVSINVAWLAVWQYFVWREVRLTPWAAFKDIAPFALTAAAAMAAAYFLTDGIDNLYLKMGTKVVAAAAFYTGIMRWADAAILRECLNYFTKKNKP